MSLPEGLLAELDELEMIMRRAPRELRYEAVAQVATQAGPLPVWCLELGTQAPDAPAVGFFGGVHGLERIGTQVVLAFLHTLVERLRWDESLWQTLQKVRLVFMPLVNPGGMMRGTRANPAGVDLMRNAPVEGDGRVAFMLGGHRLSPSLPWYRGPPGGPMQPEAAALCRVVEQRLLAHPFSLSVDCHSGFGTRNHIWFPYARTRKPIDCLAEIYALRTMFRSNHPNHSIYVIEPQARRYTTHGDLWDHLYDRSRASGTGLFLPFTLEMGSWLWVRKNPMQLFRRPGMFNPVQPHRVKRVLRQHLVFLDFLIRAAISHQRWRPTEMERLGLYESAVAYWSGDRPASMTAVR